MSTENIQPIFKIEVGSGDEWKRDERQRPEIGPSTQIQEIPFESPRERERRERDEAVIRDGVLDWLKRGGRIDDLIKKGPQTPIIH